MDAAERLELIRERLSRPKVAGFKPTGLHRATHPDMPAWPKRQKDTTTLEQFRAPPVPVFTEFYAPRHEFTTKWVGEPDAVPRVACAPKMRRKGKHYLSEIAEKVPGKLALLSENLWRDNKP